MKVVHKKKQTEIVQLKITLKRSKPPIWRRILIEKEMTFEDLHYIIQDVMGWENCHLHEFRDNNVVIDEDDFFGDGNIDSSEITLREHFTRLKQKITYTYDFGDSWEHEILVEKFLDRDKEIDYPICIKGKNNCPPEDCGGIWGFYSMLEIIQDKNHPEREEMLEWIGEDYDPEHFDLEETNERFF
ncbi:MAG: plasmid pRiA4b ORF-3 family protein [Polaribacter sp.]